MPISAHPKFSPPWLSLLSDFSSSEEANLEQLNLIVSQLPQAKRRREWLRRRNLLDLYTTSRFYPSFQPFRHTAFYKLLKLLNGPEVPNHLLRCFIPLLPALQGHRTASVLILGKDSLRESLRHLLIPPFLPVNNVWKSGMPHHDELDGAPERK